MMRKRILKAVAAAATAVGLIAAWKYGRGKYTAYLAAGQRSKGASQ